MTDDWVILSCFGLALWSAVIGGVFSAFSEFVMSGLRRAAPAAGIEAMQQINRTVLKTPFVFGLMAIAPLSTAMVYYGWTSIEGVPKISLALGATVYTPSVFLMTLFGNVPLNNRLARLDHRSREAAAYWKVYARHWTRLNHIRTMGCVLTAAIYLFTGGVLAGALR